MYRILENYSQFRVIDRLLSPRCPSDNLADAQAAAAEFPGGFVEGFNYVEGIWVRIGEVRHA